MNAGKILHTIRLVILLNWIASGSIMDPNIVDLEKFATWRQARLLGRIVLQESDRRQTVIHLLDPPDQVSGNGKATSFEQHRG
ncbi:MAG: hypothetical protein AAF483_30690 [Planctomycetota bacterium]